VLNFTHRTFAEFVADVTGKDIWAVEYSYASGSKANRMRAFWKVEPNHIVGRLLAGLLEYCRESNAEIIHNGQYEECQHIVQRLQQGAPVQDLEAITPNQGGRDFEVLAKSVREHIDKNEPEAGLDRLHTFTVKYVRVLCEKRGIMVDREKPLHSLVGEYVKKLKQAGLIESPMTERILKSSISTLEAFNSVRNEQSLAHDNPVLNYGESLLIFNHVASAIRFVRDLEDRAEQAANNLGSEADPEDDVPF
jgi:hypothetical protein